MYKLVPTHVRRRVEFILHLRAQGSPSVMAQQTGVQRNIITHALDKNRQNLSQQTAIALWNTYGASPNFLYGGDWSGLPYELRATIGEWIAKGWWSLEDDAPADDVEALLKKPEG